MPNRILKESICRSEEIDALTPFEEVLFYRLIVNCDDFGRFDGRTKIIKSSCFPLKRTTEADIEKALKKLSEVGLAIVYEVHGMPVLQLITWEKHQNRRASKSKYPAFDNTCKQLYADDNNCARTRISYLDTRNSILDYCTEQTSFSAQEPEKTQHVIAIPLVSGEYYVTEDDYEEYRRLYPGVDVMQCLRSMRGWALSNPKKRKTEKGIRRFINSWLDREQNTVRPGQKSCSGNKWDPSGKQEYDFSALEKDLLSN